MSKIRKALAGAAAAAAITVAPLAAPEVAEASPVHGTLHHCFYAHANLKVFYPEAALAVYFRHWSGVDVCIFGHRDGTSIGEVNVYSHYTWWTHS